MTHLNTQIKILYRIPPSTYWIPPFYNSIHSKGSGAKGHSWVWPPGQPSWQRGWPLATLAACQPSPHPEPRYQSMPPFTPEILQLSGSQHPRALWAGRALHAGRSVPPATPIYRAYWCPPHACSARAHVDVFLTAPGSAHQRAGCGVAAMPRPGHPRGPARRSRGGGGCLSGMEGPPGWPMGQMACLHAGRRRFANRRRLAVN